MECLVTIFGVELTLFHLVCAFSQMTFVGRRKVCDFLETKYSWQETDQILLLPLGSKTQKAVVSLNLIPLTT